MLIGLHAFYSDHTLLQVRSFQLESMLKHEIMVMACQVGPLHLTLTQINSMNCIAKNKCPDSQKLDTGPRGEIFNATSHVSRLALTCIFLHSFSLIYSM